MKFHERMAAILEYCTEPKPSELIKEKFNISFQATYRCIRILKAGGYIEKLQVKGNPNNHGATFIWTGKSYDIVSTRKKPSTKHLKGHMICGVRF